MADASAPVNDESVAVTGHLSPKPAAMTAGPLVVESGVASTEDAECHPAGPDAGSSEGNTHQLLRLPSERVYSLVCSWKGQKHEVEVNETDTVGDLKATLYSLTDVPPQRMKLIGLTKKLPGDEVEIASLGLSSGILTKFMMVRTGGHILCSLCESVSNQYLLDPTDRHAGRAGAQGTSRPR